MVAEKLPGPFQASVGKKFPYMLVGDDAPAPLAPDGIHGHIPDQNANEDCGQRGVKTDHPQMNKKPRGEQGEFFRNGQTQSAQKKDQEESGIDEFIGVVAEEDD